MFFPYFRAKRFEVLALRAATADLTAAGNVLPVIEPVRDEWNGLKRILDDGLRLGLVTNPAFGNYSLPGPRGRRGQAPLPPHSAAVYSHGNAIPAMLIDRGTTVADITTFARNYRTAKMFIVNGLPRAAIPNPLSTALLQHGPTYVAVKRRAIQAQGGAGIWVDLVDNFVRQDVNALYQFDEFYTDRHISIRTDPTFSHFGDFSIQGDHYRDGGGRAHNVALHHVYTVGPNPSDLRIRHYVSAQHPDVATMWHDALTALVNDSQNLSALSRLNDTPIVGEYRTMHAARNFPGLGKMKELAIRHHLLLMATVQ